MKGKIMETIYDRGISILSAVLGTCVVCFLGGWDKIIQCLVAFMIIDYITGIISAYYSKELNSKVGFVGIIKKVVIILIITVSVMLDKAVGNTDMVFRTATCFFYIANEALSILENATKLGLPLPKKITEALIQLKVEESYQSDDKDDKGEGD